MNGVGVGKGNSNTSQGIGTLTDYERDYVTKLEAKYNELRKESAEAEAKYIDLQNAHMELIMAEDTTGQYAEEKLRNRALEDKYKQLKKLHDNLTFEHEKLNE